MTTTDTPAKYADNGSRIRRARKRTGQSQENFALAIGITRRHMIRLENGEHLPSKALVARIAEATDTPETDYESFDGDDEGDRSVRPSLAQDLQSLASLAALMESNPAKVRELLAEVAAA